MPVYVDDLVAHGWKMHGKMVRSCHLFADTAEELHAAAEKLGLKPEWFQNHWPRLPHYDLVENKRIQAVKNGAIELNMFESVKKWKEIRAARDK